MCSKVRGVADGPEYFVLHLILVFSLLAWNHNLESNILSLLSIVSHPDSGVAAPAKLVLYAISPGQLFPNTHRIIEALAIPFKGLGLVDNIAFSIRIHELAIVAAVSALGNHLFCRCLHRIGVEKEVLTTSKL